MAASTPKRVFTGTAFLLLSSTSAFAVDAQAFAERLETVLEQQGLSLSFEQAEEQEQDVVIRGATFEVDDHALEIGDLRFEEVTGSATEGFEADRLALDEIGRDNLGTAWSVNDILFERIRIAGTDRASATPTPADFYFDRASVAESNITKEGQTSFSLTGSEIVNETADDGTITTDFDLGRFEIDLTIDEPSKDRKIIANLGYEQISGSVAGDAFWDPNTGELRVGPVVMSADEAGIIEFSYTINGYTPAFAESLAELQQSLAEPSDDDQGQTMAVIGLASQLSLEQLEISYRDASLANRLLDYYAGLSNQTREQFVSTLNAMIPPMLAGLQNESFQSEISAALSQFLEEPQSISISIDPKAPVPAAQIIGAAVGAPQTLPDVLSVEVTANAGDDTGQGADQAGTQSGPDDGSNGEPYLPRAAPDLPLTDIPEIPSQDTPLQSESCRSGGSQDGDASNQQTLTEQLQNCGGVLVPPYAGDADIEAPAPDSDPGTTPIIPPEALPPEQPRESAK